MFNNIIIDFLLKKYYNGDNQDLFKRLTDYCGKPLSLNMSKIIPEGKWDFYHSLFFVITVVSTIGYGNLAPTTMLSRILMIFYGLVGIPLNGIVMISTGAYFGRNFEKLYDRWKVQRKSKKGRQENSIARLGLISQIFLYATPGFIFFIFLPSFIMTFCEGWEYDVSVYYSFVTLTTIGFGDYVAGVNNVYNIHPIWYAIYQAFLIIWVIGGLGYVLMVINFIAQGMKSKKVLRLEEYIKKTPQRIRHELSTLLHEFLLIKVKPVYKNQWEFEPKPLARTQSCPDISMYRSDDSIYEVRKRAFSVVVGNLQRNQSDTELEKIDKELTFRPSDALMQQRNLLLKMVDALSQKSDPGEGINLFSDDEILASERYGSNSTLAAISQSRQARRRAMSDYRPPDKTFYEVENGNTWYGEDAKKKSDQFRNRTNSVSFIQRVRKSSNIFQRFRDAFGSNQDKNVDVESQTVNETRNENIERQNYLQKTARGRQTMFCVPEENFLRRQNNFDAERRNYLQRTNRGRFSMFEAPEQNYLRQTRTGRQSISNYNESVLEQTSVADFIRALTALTVSEGIAGDGPKRKLGTASFTPPESTSPQRTRRTGIQSTFQNRRASLLPTQTTNVPVARRFSLRPVDENILGPPPPYSPAPAEIRRSIRSRNRRFSIRPGPVERQVIKKDRNDSTSDKQ
ncbi:open rectifier potassium channel protein 1 isoform X2 [Aethina tumida]|uniref:open rectifier potassium channel protein 1 isoform X2 n=1 Tax=Aethina tumida TaxID=116153 RepID=UPI002147A4E0|nr:open rectifier potassium channel protein 1 isoform X2 [Aethina tumida]